MNGRYIEETATADIMDDSDYSAARAQAVARALFDSIEKTDNRDLISAALLIYRARVSVDDTSPFLMLSDALLRMGLIEK